VTGPTPHRYAIGPLPLPRKQRGEAIVCASVQSFSAGGDPLKTKRAGRGPRSSVDDGPDTAAGGVARADAVLRPGGLAARRAHAQGVARPPTMSSTLCPEPMKYSTAPSRSRKRRIDSPAMILLTETGEDCRATLPGFPYWGLSDFSREPRRRRGHASPKRRFAEAPRLGRVPPKIHLAYSR
jgi:hypothetical protein